MEYCGGGSLQDIYHGTNKDATVPSPKKNMNMNSQIDTHTQAYPFSHKWKLYGFEEWTFLCFFFFFIFYPPTDFFFVDFFFSLSDGAFVRIPNRVCVSGNPTGTSSLSLSSSCPAISDSCSRSCTPHHLISSSQLQSLSASNAFWVVRVSNKQWGCELQTARQILR